MLPLVEECSYTKKLHLAMFTLEFPTVVEASCFTSYVPMICKGLDILRSVRKGNMFLPCLFVSCI